MENHAVWLRNLQLPSVHNKQSFFQIGGKKGERPRILVQRHQMAVVREQRHILGIFTAHRQTQQLGKKPRFPVNFINRRAVVPRIGAAQIIIIIGQVQRARRGTARMIICLLYTSRCV